MFIVALSASIEGVRVTGKGFSVHWLKFENEELLFSMLLSVHYIGS